MFLIWSAELLARKWIPHSYTNINMLDPRNEYLLLACGYSIIEGIIKDIIKAL